MIYLLLLVSFLLRLAFISGWLEDWDSVQFALALRDFDISKHQPHAPGYILYIVLAKVLFLFTKNETLALTLLSAVSGTLLILAVYLLSKKLFDKTTAIFASILVSITPISWLMSEVALTNIVGLVAITFFALILVRAKDSMLPSLLAGFILGIRATELPIITTLLAVKRIFSPVAFVLGVSLWLIPTIIASGGLEKSFESFRWIATYVLTHDAPMDNRLERLKYLFNISYTAPFLAISAISLFYMLLQRQKNQGIYITLTWFISYLIPLVFIYNLEVPRYTLPLSIPFSIATSWFLTNKLNPKLAAVTLVLTISVLLHQGLSQVTKLKLTPPTISAVKFVKENFKPNDTIVISSFLFRHFQYYAPSFTNYYGLENLKTSPNTKSVIVDYNGFIGSEKLKEYNVIDEKTFEGPPEIFPRVFKTELIVLKRK